jgi:hypothetical protein
MRTKTPAETYILWAITKPHGGPIPLVVGRLSACQRDHVKRSKEQPGVWVDYQTRKQSAGMPELEPASGLFKLGA